jgi:hypothetical protein
MADQAHEVIPGGQGGIPASALDEQPFVRLFALDLQDAGERPDPRLTLLYHRDVSGEPLLPDRGILLGAFSAERLSLFR